MAFAGIGKAFSSLGAALGLGGAAAAEESQMERNYKEKETKKKRLFEIEQELSKKPYEIDVLSIPSHQRNRNFILKQYNAGKARAPGEIGIDMNRANVGALLQEYFRLRSEIKELHEKTTQSFKLGAAAHSPSSGRYSPVGFAVDREGAAAPAPPVRSPNAPVGFRYASGMPPLTGRRSPTAAEVAAAVGGEGPAEGEGGAVVARPLGLQAYSPLTKRTLPSATLGTPTGKLSVGGRRHKKKSHGRNSKKTKQTLRRDRGRRQRTRRN